MTKDGKTYQVVAGIDVGNGYVKAKLAVDGAKPVTVDIPSCVSYTVGSDLPKEPTPDYLGRLAGELDCHVFSRGVRDADQERVLFGTRAIRSGESQVEFNIDNHVPKCQDSLSTMLVLGTIASVVCAHATAEAGELPHHVDARCELGVALPIEDYMEWRDRYESTLVGESHRVLIHNFSHDVDVVITFDGVEVLPEGAAAQYAITKLGAPFLQLALDSARAQGFPIDPAYTGEMLAGARSTIGVDVGEGTVNFPVFSDGDVSVESSTSINEGYGSVLTHVVAELRNTPYAFSSRKDLADFLLEEHTLPTKRLIAAKARQMLDRHIRVFVRDVIKEYSNVFRKVGMRTDVVYVYGGGANSVRNALYPALVEASTLDDLGCLPVIYLDSKWSRDLNRNGLYEAARVSAEARR